MRGTFAWPPTRLIPWFSKTEGNTYATLLHHPFLCKGKATHAQEIARRTSGTVAGESTHKSRHTKYPSQMCIPHITLFAICLSFSSPPIHPCHFIRPLFPFAFFPCVSFLVFPCAFYLLASLLAKNQLIWIHLKCSTWIIFDLYALMLKAQPA